MPVTSLLRKELLVTSWEGKTVTMNNSTIDSGKTREPESQDSTDLVSKGDGRLVHNTWSSERFRGKLFDQKTAGVRLYTECLVRDGQICDPHGLASDITARICRCNVRKWPGLPN